MSVRVCGFPGRWLSGLEALSSVPSSLEFRACWETEMQGGRGSAAEPMVGVPTWLGRAWSSGSLRP